jgi:hypothetical protein
MCTTTSTHHDHDYIEWTGNIQVHHHCHGSH